MGKIRLWKLGNLEHKISPTQAAIQRLYEILSEVDNTKTEDIIWGPGIDVEVVEDGELEIISIPNPNGPNGDGYDYIQVKKK
jgi:hypothetical protein